MAEPLLNAEDATLDDPHPALDSAESAASESAESELESGAGA